MPHVPTAERHWWLAEGGRRVDPDTLKAITDLIIQGGAIVVLVWVVNLLLSGKLHTDSEVDGLRRDKADLLVANKDLSEALDQNTELLRLAIERGGRS